MENTVILAYSGGLDTSVAIRWLQETYGYNVITLTVDIGNEKDINAVANRAKVIGAQKAITVDAKQDFLKYFVWPALQANALYEGVKISFLFFTQIETFLFTSSRVLLCILLSMM